MSVFPTNTVPAKLCEQEIAGAMRYKKIFEQASVVSGIPTPILMGICSRETGFKNVIGDKGHGHGLMQIDDRYHRGFIQSGVAMEPEANVTFAAKLLQRLVCSVLAKFPEWNGQWILRGALVAYNAGLANVQSQENIDVGTTNNNYSADVLRRAFRLRNI